MIVMEDHPISPVAATQLSRQQILETTARCLSEEGYDNTTIRRIAAKLDCAVGSIYRYFRDKRDLLDVVAQSVLEPVALNVEAGASVEDSARLYHQIASGDLAMYRLMFWVHTVGATTTSTDALPPVVQRIVAGWSHRLGDQSLARRCWIALHGGIMMGISGDDIRVMMAQVFLSPSAKAPALSGVSHTSQKPTRQTRTPGAMVREAVVVEVVEKSFDPRMNVAEHLAHEDVVLL